MFYEFITRLRSDGSIGFTFEQALNELGVTPVALRCGLYRLMKKGSIISPARHLYVIVPPEESKFGSIPAEELVPIIMKHMGADYYVGLLSASLYHGSSHQKPQVFQVITNKRLKPLGFGRIRIEFVYKKKLDNVIFSNKTVKTGYLKVSSPEYTIMDLFLYPKHVGGLNHIATILSELVDEIDIDKLTEVFELSNRINWIQRLGYILECIGDSDDAVKARLAAGIYDYVSVRDLRYIPLAEKIPTKGFPKNKKWKIIQNTVIESDL